MRFYIFLVLPLIVGICINGCKSSSLAGKGKYNKVIFGSGGGFTGAVTEYSVDLKGNLTQFNSLNKETVSVGKFSKKDTKELFKEILALNTAETDFNHPGNMYYFLGVGEEKEKYLVTWGDQGHPVPEDIQNTYDKLAGLVKSMKEPIK